MDAGRQFLGFEQPALRSASELLIERYRGDERADLGQVIVVVPGARAGRRLRVHLAQSCHERRLGLLAPRIVTASHLPELLYRPQRPFASEPLQQMMWARGLRQLDADSLRAILPNAPASNSATDARAWSESDWLECGTIFWRQYRGLAAEGLSFADVSEMGIGLPHFPESRRWQTLAILQTEYLRQLDAELLWDKQTARLVAVRNKECTTDCHIYLLGTSDLSQTLRQMLEQVSNRVTPLVHAPPAWADRFDGLGCLDVNAWCDSRIPIDDDLWSVADRPSDQARALATNIAKLDTETRFDEVRVGCADERLVPYMQRVFAELDVPCRWGPGRAIEQSGPYQLLKILHDWLIDDRFENLAALARHPQIASWLTTHGIRDDWLRQLDRFHEQALPATSAKLPTKAPRYAMTEATLTALNRLRAGLAGKKRTARLWAQKISETLSDVYAPLPKLFNDIDNRFEFAVCEKVQGAIDTVSSVPDSCSPTMSAAEVLHVIMSQLEGDSIPPTQSDDVVELLGWLELPLDDAPHLFIGGINEGVVPQAVTSDLFLPNRIREHLGIDDDRQRFARDAYALTVLLASRQTIHLVTAKCDAEGNPLKPSRLLFADSPEVVAKRWQRLVASTVEPGGQELFDMTGQEFGFRVPEAKPLPLLEEIRVTDFRVFLQCPYRYYLEKRLGLRTVEHQFSELKASDFGTLIHDVLGRFGNSEWKDSTDKRQIESVLLSYLEDEVKRRLGPSPLAAAQVQVSQIKRRLKFFAAEQAKLVDEGWSIHYSESNEKDETTHFVWNVDDHDVRVCGRIDRIDVHAETGTFRVIDYKTSDTGDKTPEKTHRLRSGDWTNLQLPLYRHLATTFGVAGTPELSYFIIGKDATQTGIYVADWDEVSLASADETARNIIARILQNDYGEPAVLAKSYDSWKYICLEGVPRR